MKDQMTDNPMNIPATVSSITHKTRIDGHKLYLTVATHKQIPVAVFIRIAKRGSTLAGFCDAFCRAFSMALQHGMPLSTAVRAFDGMTFEPYGATDTPEIPEARSIVDFVVKYLDLHWGDALVETRGKTDPSVVTAIKEPAEMDNDGPIKENKP